MGMGWAENDNDPETSTSSITTPGRTLRALRDIFFPLVERHCVLRVTAVLDTGNVRDDGYLARGSWMCKMDYALYLI
jgi:hypothetical protein